MDEEFTPTGSDDRTKKLGKWLTGSGVMNGCLLVVVGLLAMTVIRQVHIIDALVVGVTQQRDQFNACKNKPATAAGCTTPVAAEPSVIVKQGSRGPGGIAGTNGLTPPCYFEARQCRGLDGKDATPAKPGRDGITPPCMQTPRQCQGTDGKDAPTPAPAKDGKDGASPPCLNTESQCQGKDGKDGVTPACWFEPTQCQGPAGIPGVAGADGYSVIDQDCIGDGEQSFWRVTLNNGKDQRTIDAAGPCRVGPELP